MVRLGVLQLSKYCVEVLLKQVCCSHGGAGILCEDERLRLVDILSSNRCVFGLLRVGSSSVCLWCCRWDGGCWIQRVEADGVTTATTATSTTSISSIGNDDVVAVVVVRVDIVIAG